MEEKWIRQKRERREKVLLHVVTLGSFKREGEKDPPSPYVLPLALAI